MTVQCINNIQVVILAAGKSTRMHSKLPKVLHPLAGKPILQHVLETAQKISQGSKPLVIVGHEREKIQQALQKYDVEWIVQSQQLGTGHAVLQALPHLKDDARVLILYGDVPLISEKTLEQLIEHTSLPDIGMITAFLSNPMGYGRIKRDAQQKIVQIVEEKDATQEEKAIKEINSGIYLVPAHYLKNSLPKLKNENHQKEYYLTDIVTLAVADNVHIETHHPAFKEEIFGVNDRIQLAALERFYQLEQAKYWMKKGVTIIDPARFDVRGDISIGKDVVIDVNVILEGKVDIGDDCYIGPQVYLRDVMLSNSVEIKSNSVIEGATIETQAIIGPFARIRPQTTIGSAVHIGNFVEVKNSQIDVQTKINHLSYIGDSEIGRFVNIGAGTITCNYDGAVKHKTIIHDHVHIGSDTQLVAPVTIGEGATIAAGSTIIKDAEANQLTLSHRLEQRTLKGWQRPQKERKSS